MCIVLVTVASIFLDSCTLALIRMRGCLIVALNDRIQWGVEFLRSLEEGKFDDEDIFEDLSSELLNEFACSRC